MTNQELEQLLETLGRVQADRQLLGLGHSGELDWFIAGARSYLAGDADTIDEALGLVEKARMAHSRRHPQGTCARSRLATRRGR